MNEVDTQVPQHVEAGHEPGCLYDCRACETEHVYDGDVHCAMVAERLEAEIFPSVNDVALWRCPCGDVVAVAAERSHFAAKDHKPEHVPPYLRKLT